MTEDKLCFLLNDFKQLKLTHSKLHDNPDRRFSKDERFLQIVLLKPPYSHVCLNCHLNLSTYIYPVRQ